MKVRLIKNYKELFTLADLERAKVVVAYCKEDSSKVEDYAVFAINEACKGTTDCLERILEADAVVMQNGRAWDAYGEGSGHMDVRVEIIAKTYGGYIEASAWLTDIWQTGADFDYKDKMYIVHYKRDWEF